MKKNYSISLIRLISLFLIISCHIFQALNLEIAFWLNVGVQIYFFMSGYLYGTKDRINNPLKWYKKQFIKIILPLLVVEIIMLIVDKLCIGMSYSKYTLLANIIGLGGNYQTLQTLSHTWFVTYILFCYLLTPLLHTFNFNKLNKRQFIVSMFIIAIALQFLNMFKIIDLNPAYIFNYILGFAFANYYIKNNKSYNKFAIAITILTILLLIPRILIQYKYITNIPLYILDNQTYLISWSHVFLGSTIFILLLSLFSRIKIKEHVLLNLSDKWNYYIYLVHQIFILNYLSVMNFTKYLALNIIFAVDLALLGGIILYYIVRLIYKH